jgi:hypothetical protein
MVFALISFLLLITLAACAPNPTPTTSLNAAPRQADPASGQTLAAELYDWKNPNGHFTLINWQLWIVCGIFLLNLLTVVYFGLKDLNRKRKQLKEADSS